jgi:8-oxo-dGTP diphosphatase
MKHVTHLGTYGILLKNNEILLIEKSRGPYKGMLDLPGGKLEHGENVEEALAREILEETGIKAGDMKLIGNDTTVVSFEDDRGPISMYHVGLIYEVTKIDDSGLIQKMDEEDSLGASWYKLSDLDLVKLSPFARRVVSSL